MLAKYTLFVFDDDYLKAFHKLCATLTTTLIMRPPDWFLFFTIMHDASDFMIDVVLEQKVNKESHMIYYTSKTFF